MSEQSRVIFLHLPKTAGQSVHLFLERLFGKTAVAPARVNEQLIRMSITDVRRYRVFSGHLDWALLDCVKEPCFTFTVLRDPIDRILSFYFYLRSEALKLSVEELSSPQRQGLHAALNLSCDEYFTAGKVPLRAFLDNHYDNFYAYFFAGRTYNARQQLFGQKQIDATFTDDKIVEMALSNLALLDGLYPIDRLDLLEKDLRAIAGASAEAPSSQIPRVNRGNDKTSHQRMDDLRKLGATEITFQRLRQMTILDEKIWKYVCEGKQTRRPSNQPAE
jgi:hypothetical protein